MAIGCLILVLVAVNAGLFDELVTSGVETEAVGTIGLAERSSTEWKAIAGVQGGRCRRCKPATWGLKLF